MKKEILNKINSNLFDQERLSKNMYRGKTFLVVRDCGMIDKSYKTRSCLLYTSDAADEEFAV